jgi:hypothetical protein
MWHGVIDLIVRLCCLFVSGLGRGTGVGWWNGTGAISISVPQLSMSIAPVDEDVRSVALPFAAKPKNLNGELVGDFGFDPFKFTDKGKPTRHLPVSSDILHQAPPTGSDRQYPTIG